MERDKFQAREAPYNRSWVGLTACSIETPFLTVSHLERFPREASYRSASRTAVAPVRLGAQLLIPEVSYLPVGSLTQRLAHLLPAIIEPQAPRAGGHSPS